MANLVAKLVTNNKVYTETYNQIDLESAEILAREFKNCGWEVTLDVLKP